MKTLLVLFAAITVSAAPILVTFDPPHQTLYFGGGDDFITGTVVNPNPEALYIRNYTGTLGSPFLLLVGWDTILIPANSTYVGPILRTLPFLCNLPGCLEPGTYSGDLAFEWRNSTNPFVTLYTSSPASLTVTVTTETPEPATWGLWFLGLALIATGRRFTHQTKRSL